MGERKGAFPGMIQKRQLHIVVAAPGTGQGIAEANDAGKYIEYSGQQTIVRF